MYESNSKDVEPSVVRAQYGVGLEKAAEEAIDFRQSDLKLISMLSLPVRPYVFDFFGLRFPLNADTTVAELVASVRECHVIRALAYETTPVPANAKERVQSGQGGDRLDNAIASAIECAQLWGNRAYEGGLPAFAAVRHVFEFNGVTLPFNPWATGEAARLYVDVQVAQDEAAEAYRNSDKGRAAQAKADAARQAIQDQVAVLMAELPTVVKKPLPELMAWVTEFSKGHDYVGVDTDPDTVVSVFNAEGYAANVYVGDDYKAQLAVEKEAFGRYIIGQFLQILPMRRGMPGILWHMADQYFARPDAVAA